MKKAVRARRRGGSAALAARRRPADGRPTGELNRRYVGRRLAPAVGPTRASVSTLTVARRELTRFVEDQAVRTARDVGFSWRPDSAAPDRYDVLLAAYQNSVDTGQALAVSDLYCESTVYVSPGANMAFRYWHDVNHVRRGLSFGLVDELKLADLHLAELTASGLGPQTTAWQLLHADLVGQIYVMALIDRFPLAQGAFALDCVRRGFDVAVEAECRLSGTL